MPVAVQGAGAANEIANGIKTMNDKKLADVIILARGGGSLEDLWPFNEEVVARAIYNSEIPIVSAIGHETDFTISDFVSDLRAPTPSAAAELVNPDIYELQNKVNTLKERARISLNKKIEIARLKYKAITQKRVLTEPLQNIQNYYLRIDGFIKQMENVINLKTSEAKKIFVEKVSKLDTLSPLKTLTRGYAIVEKDNKLIKTSKDLKKGDLIELKFSDGKWKAVIGDVLF